MKRYWILICLISLCLLSAGCATSLVVDSKSDEPDINTTDGKCETVNNECTLRAAIMEANVSDDVSLITFSVTGAITPATELPALTASNTNIDGGGVVILNGLFAEEADFGLEIRGSSYNIIQGLTIKKYPVGVFINGYTGTAKYNIIGQNPSNPNNTYLPNVIILNSEGVKIGGPDAFNNTVAGNYIGVKQDGNIKGNYLGISIVGGAYQNTIGSISGSGLTQGGNLISGSEGGGISLNGAVQNHISGNYIGTSADGLAAAGNETGIQVQNGSNNNIIGIAPNGSGSLNLISGNTNDGLVIAGSNNNHVSGNYIGTDIGGTLPLGNDRGVMVRSGASGNVIGTDGDGSNDANEGNLISGNLDAGLWVYDSNTSNNVIAGNLVGTTFDGASALGNGSVGVTVGGNFNRVGTNGDGVSDQLEANVVSGNNNTGIFLAADGNWVAGNFVGTDITGMLAIGNLYDGITLNPEADNNLIGTNGDGVADTAERNIISGNNIGFNGTAGIDISGNGNVVAGNYVGTDATGNTMLPNLQYGITLSNGANGNLIGTDGDGIADTAEGNLVSGNGYLGIGLFTASSNRIAGNFVGTNAAGTAAVPNTHSLNEQVGGINLAYGSSNNIIGTNSDGSGDAAERNLISGNAFHGIVIEGDGSANNIVAGNYIGTDVTGTAAIGNLVGIMITSPLGGNRIGTNGDGSNDIAERNLISGNLSSGIFLTGEDTQIAGNFIGTDVSGTAPLGNGLHGIYVNDGASNTEIGGSELKANVIAFNTRDGVYVNGNSIDQVQILYNSIFSNDETGIDLQLGGSGTWFTPNDPGDTDTGPNDVMNFPNLTAAAALPNQITIDGVIGDGLPATSFLIQVFDNEVCDTPSDHGEGKVYLGSVNTTTNANGFATFQLVIPAAVTPGHFITSTATAGNKTSEFSECVEVVGMQQYSSEPRCDLFDQLQISVITFDVDPAVLSYGIYLQTPGVPGLEVPVPGDTGEWDYTAMLGNVQAAKCDFQGYAGRLYCDFDIPETYLNSAQTLQVFVNGCTPPIFTHPGISVFPIEPAPVCTRELDEDACTAAGGTYACTAACYCTCP